MPQALRLLARCADAAPPGDARVLAITQRAHGLALHGELAQGLSLLRETALDYNVQAGAPSHPADGGLGHLSTAAEAHLRGVLGTMCASATLSPSRRRHTSTPAPAAAAEPALPGYSSS